METAAAMGTEWEHRAMNTEQSGRGAGRRPKPEDQEDLDVPRTVLLTASDSARFDTWLRRNHPGSKPGPWMRQVILDAMEQGAHTNEARSRITLHLNEEDRERIMAVARELGHRDLAVFAEELLLRAAQRDPDEVIRFFRGKPVPVLSLVPPAGTEAEPMIHMREMLERILDRQQDEDAKSA